MKLVVAPGWPLAKIGLGPPRSTSTRSIVSSRRKIELSSRNESDEGAMIGEPFISTVRNGASPVEGKPRMKTLAPAWPPELSTHTPGTILSRSAVEVGWTSRICSAEAVEIE